MEARAESRKDVQRRNICLERSVRIEHGKTQHQGKRNGARTLVAVHFSGVCSRWELSASRRDPSIPRKMVAAIDKGFVQDFLEAAAIGPSRAFNGCFSAVGCICSTKHSILEFRLVAAIANHGA
ncbi:MAG: hypothetical protein HIU89_11000 [Proteobacteria bacterium]|nr:hypothetical protein [Pseudomonadota bacterium]